MYTERISAGLTVTLTLSNTIRIGNGTVMSECTLEGFERADLAVLRLIFHFTDCRLSAYMCFRKYLIRLIRLI